MGLFGKKVCCVCGEKTGMGKKQIKDGLLCKQCMEKLSPFFLFDHEPTSVELTDHMKWREESKAAFGSFTRTRSYDNFGWKLCIDDEHRQFLIEDGKTQYPDIFSFDDIVDCHPGRHQRIKTTRRNREDQNEYYYDFRLVFELNHRFLKKCWYQYSKDALNTGSTRITDDALDKARSRGGTKLGRAKNLLGGLTNEMVEEYDAQIARGEELAREILDSIKG